MVLNSHHIKIHLINPNFGTLKSYSESDSVIVDCFNRDFWLVRLFCLDLDLEFSFEFEFDLELGSDVAWLDGFVGSDDMALGLILKISEEGGELTLRPRF